MARRWEGEGMMGVIEKNFARNKVYTGRRHLSDNLRERAETVKTVVRSFESLRDLPRPLLQLAPTFRSRDSLRDLRSSCESIRSVKTGGLVSPEDSSPDCGHSVRSAPGNIERSSTLQVRSLH